MGSAIFAKLPQQIFDNKIDQSLISFPISQFVKAKAHNRVIYSFNRIRIQFTNTRKTIYSLNQILKPQYIVNSILNSRLIMTIRSLLKYFCFL